MEVPLTPLRFLIGSARDRARETAIVCGEHGETYGEYAARVRRLAGALRALGVGRGDRVLYLGMNCHRLLELYYGVLPLEAILVPVNVRLAPGDVAFILQDAAPTVLVASPELLPLLSRVPLPASVRHRVLAYAAPQGDAAGWLDFDTMLAAADEMPLTDAVDERSVAEIFYTSGTTARPRGVMLTHRTLYLHALSCIMALGTSDRTRMLVGSVPLFHVNAWGQPQYMVAAGGIQVVVPRFDPPMFCDVVTRHRITHALMVPTMLTALLQYAAQAHPDLSSIERILIGGAPPPPALLARARQEFGLDCIVGYGMTETSPVVSLSLPKAHMAGAPPEELARRQSLTGLPLIGVDVRVAHDDGSDVVRDGQDVGEILVRSDIVMEGYWNRPEDTAVALAGGWMHTGDLAVVDDEGYLNVVDRKKDIIISGGENIASVEIEAALYSHPAVLEAAVVAAPDERWGEVPVAFVALRPGHSVTAEALCAHARDRIAHFKVPHAVEFVDELPKTGTGKVQKAILRQRLREAQRPASAS